VFIIILLEKDKYLNLFFWYAKIQKPAKFQYEIFRIYKNAINQAKSVKRRLTSNQEMQFSH